MTFDLAASGSAALTRGLLRSGVAAGPLFVTVFLAEGARRADYQPSRHPVSSLSLGSHGWVQAANFSAAGTLCVAGAAGLSRSRDAIIGARLVPWPAILRRVPHGPSWRLPARDTRRSARAERINDQARRRRDPDLLRPPGGRACLRLAIPPGRPPTVGLLLRCYGGLDGSEPRSRGRRLQPGTRAR